MESEGKRAKLNLVLDELNINLSDIQRKQMEGYVEILMTASKVMNLTGEKDVSKLIVRQIYDSLYLMKILKIENEKKVIDLGTGGGLPGMPLKICLPDMELSLLDSNNKKITFLMETVKRLQLENVKYLHGRAEEWGNHSDHREKYDYILCKAVAEMYLLAELALPLLKLGGKALFYKGPKGTEEVRRARKALDVNGGKVSTVREYVLLSGEKRSIYVIDKIKKTPTGYPRNIDKIKKSYKRDLFS